MNVQIIARVIHSEGEISGNLFGHFIIDGILCAAGNYKVNANCAARADEFDKAICYIHILVSERRKIVYQDKYSGQRHFTDGMEVNKCAAIVISKETLALVDDTF